MLPRWDGGYQWQVALATAASRAAGLVLSTCRPSFVDGRVVVNLFFQLQLQDDARALLISVLQVSPLPNITRAMWASQVV